MCLHNTWYSTRKTNYSAILTYLPNVEKEFMKTSQENQGNDSSLEDDSASPGRASLQNMRTLVKRLHCPYESLAHWSH